MKDQDRSPAQVAKDEQALFLKAVAAQAKRDAHKAFVQQVARLQSK